MHIDVNSIFRQREFGISAGFPRFSWKCIQTTNDAASTVAKVNSTILLAWWMLDKEPERMLFAVALEQVSLNDRGAYTKT